MSSDHNDIATQVMFRVANSLSAVACIAVFLGIWIFQRPLTTALKLILLLSFSDFVTSFINLIAPIIGITDDSCQVIGFIGVVAGWTSLFWCSSISLLAFLTMGNFERLSVTILFRNVIIASVIASILIACLPIWHVTGLQYQNIDNFCRTTYQTQGFTLPRILVFIFVRGFGLGLAIVITLLAYLRAHELFKSIPENIAEAYQLDSKKLLFYPAAQLLIYLPSTTYVFICIWAKASQPWISIIAYWCSLAGFINSVVYGLQFMHMRRGHMMTVSGAKAPAISMSKVRLEPRVSRNELDGEMDHTMSLTSDIDKSDIDLLTRNRRESSISRSVDLHKTLHIVSTTNED